MTLKGPMPGQNILTLYNSETKGDPHIITIASEYEVLYDLSFGTLTLTSDDLERSNSRSQHLMLYSLETKGDRHIITIASIYEVICGLSFDIMIFDLR